MNHSTPFPRNHIVEHPLRHPDGRGLIGCMDRRRVQPNDPVLGGDRLFQQVRGGRFGVSDGIALAMEINRPGSFVERGIKLAHFAQGIGFILELAGVLTTKHGPTCGGIDYAEIIHHGVANGMDDAAMYAAARAFKPDITDTTYAKAIEAAQRIGKAGLVSSPEEIKTVLTTPAAVLWTPTEEPWNAGPTPHVTLTDTDHDAITFIADYRTDVALDRIAAHADGHGAYYSSFGTFEQLLELLPEEITEATGGVESWWNAEAICLGRVAAHDIMHVDPNGERVAYPIEAISRPG